MKHYTNNFIKYIFKILAVFILLFLSGCQSLIETNVNISDLQNKKYNTVHGDLYIEIAACNDYGDSRKLSSSVIEAQQTIPYIFKDAKYIECFSKEFSSYAHFDLPLIIIHKNELISNDYIHLISTKKNLLGIGIPQLIKQNMDKVKQNSYGMNDIELNVQINVKNDLKKKIKFYAISSYINDIPALYDQFEANPNDIFSVRLSNTSIDYTMQNNFSSILIYNEK